MWPGATRSGSALVFVLLVVTLLLTLAGFVLKIVYNGYAASELFWQREQAFWLAEAALVVGQDQLARNPGWYTELPHWPPDDKGWLRSTARGENLKLAGGELKVVKEEGGQAVYGLGWYKKATVILKQDEDWQEL